MKNIDKENLLFSPRYLASLIIPLTIETLLNVTIGMADTMMVSQAGEAAVSGVSVVDSIQSLMVFLLSAFATGGAVVASQYLGRGEEQKASYSAKQLMYLTLAFSLLISVIFLIFRDGTIRVIYGSLEESVFSSATAYFTPILISLPFFAVQSSANALCRSMGKSNITMWVSILVNMINIIGNAIFLFAFNMGASGVGISSAISRIIGAIIMFSLLLRKKEKIHIDNPLKFDIDLRMISRILKIALPSGLENSIFHIGKILISSTITTFGTYSIAAYAVTNNLATFANMPASAIGLASVTVIGQCCGKGSYDQVYYYGKKLLALAYITMGALDLLMFFFTPQLVGIYSLSEEATALAIRCVNLNLIQGALVWPLAFTVPNYLRAAGDVKYTMAVSVLSMWIFRVVLSNILGLYMGFGLVGVLWGMFIDWYCRSICFVQRFIKGKWKAKEVI